MIIIKDYGHPEDLEGAEMQFIVVKGDSYLRGEAVAFCATLEIARAVAHALTMTDEQIIIEGPSK